jgi:hypothetical protein
MGSRTPINEEFDTAITIDGPFGTEIPLQTCRPADLQTIAPRWPCGTV